MKVYMKRNTQVEIVLLLMEAKWSYMELAIFYNALFRNDCCYIIRSPNTLRFPRVSDKTSSVIRPVGSCHSLTSRRTRKASAAFPRVFGLGLRLLAP
jgi:hypothetical protein